MAQSFESVLGGLKAAAEPTRLRVLMLCARGELTVSEITQILGQSQPRVSRHLQVLCAAGLLIRFRERHWVYYRTPTGGDAATAVEWLREWVDPEHERLAHDFSGLEAVHAERARRAAEIFLEAKDKLGLLSEGAVDRGAIGATIAELLQPGAVGDLLDIGTGSGHMLRLLAEHASSAVGVDISADALQLARSNLHAAGLNSVMVRPGDMYRLRYPEASFDTVTLDQVISHAEHPVLALREAVRIIRPGGQLLLVDMLDAGNGKGIRRAELRDWLNRAGLRPVSRREIVGERGTFLVWVMHPGADEGDGGNESAAENIAA